MKLHQLIAVIQSAKQRMTKAKTEVYHTIQKEALFKGLQRTYSPMEEDGFVYPPESQKVVKSAGSLILDFAESCKETFNLCAAQDLANTEAKANVVVNGVTVLRDVPVSYLLFLEKQLEDVKTFVSKLPELPIDKDWTYDRNRSCYVTDTKQTVKTKKITEFVVAYEATEHHPAQIKEVTKDVVEGVWSLVEFSGALPSDSIREIQQRVIDLQKAVIQAREQANSIDVQEQDLATPVFEFIFGDRYTGSRAQV